MIYLSLAINVVVLVLLVWQKIDADLRMDRYRAEAASREISLLNRIQAPEMAVAQSFPEAEEQPHIPVDDSPYADQAWAEYQARISQ